MEKTVGVKVDSKTLISVPEGYTSVIFSNGKVFGKCGSCENKKLKSVIGSDINGRTISVLYINQRPLTDMSWGVGNIPVVYTPADKSIEIQVGASGTFLAEIVDPVAFYAAHGPESGVLTLPEVAGIITSGFRLYARELVLGLFKEAIEPMIATDFILDEAELRFEERVCGQKLTELPGVVFKKAHVGNITVREEDIEALHDFYKAKRRKR